MLFSRNATAMGQARDAEDIRSLLDAIRQNDTEASIKAQAQLYLLYYEPILKSLRMPHLLEGYSREDVVQEAFFESISAVRDGKLRDDAAFRGHWGKSTQNRLQNLRRNARKRSSIREKLSRVLYGRTAPDGERQMLDKELIARVKQLLNKLDQRCRQILRLDALDYSGAQIVAKTNLGSLNSLYVTKSRCLNKFRKIVAAQNLNDPRHE